MFGSIKSYITNNVTSLCLNSNSTLANQIRNISTYKQKTKQACSKRFMLTKSGNVKFHPRSNPGKVYYVTGTPVVKTFRNALFAQKYTKSSLYPIEWNETRVEITEYFEDEEPQQ
ncbi:hypothetical protein PPL_05655 [Heterostelium album PN500]|uniref:Uncharacterized protein n=1 Tax=Heterostelium pallidum (strain ATCC 26659 / Pp 5 / PN500) TaxID=670386 RepID=D3BAS4_HETP5|nr:hypothetical protein PPL_05655 [Heterostelium album PN500]EFA81661.1 hypothetical protein PPL_05655 [Heterostelium album PN500]|eukprot:XP_020433778.1 hypothetical protein PPL_05655 [Heterostelium album PN500]